MRFWTDEMAHADALIFGRTTYEMMRSAWRRPADGVWPTWMDAAAVAFAEAIDGARKHVVSTTLSEVDRNAEQLDRDLRENVQRLKDQPGGRLWVGGVTLPTALADLGLIDEYEFLVHPVLAGHGPTLLAGLGERVELESVDRRAFSSGVTAALYRPARTHD